MDSYLLYGKQFSTIPFPNKKCGEESFKGFKLVSEYDISIDKFIFVLKKRYYEDLGNGDALSKSFRYIYFIYNNNVIYYRLNGNIGALKRWLNARKINKESEVKQSNILISTYRKDFSNQSINSIHSCLLNTSKTRKITRLP